MVFTRRLSAKDVLTTAEEHDVHVIFGTPFHYELLTTAKSVPALPSLRAAVSGMVAPSEVGQPTRPGTVGARS